MRTLFTIQLPPVKVRKPYAPATKIVRAKKGGAYNRARAKRAGGIPLKNL